MKNKHSSSDFTINNLPHSRIQAFFDILKTQWRKMLWNFLFFFLGALPFIIVSILNLRGITYGFQSISSGSANENEVYFNMFSVNNYSNLFNIGSFLVFTIVISGLSRIYTKLCWQKGMLYFSDFGLGIKQNLLQNAFFSIIIPIMVFLVGMFHSFAHFNLNSLMPLVFVFYGIIIFVFLPWYFIFTSMSAIYEEKFIPKLRNSFSILIRVFIPLGGFIIVLVLPFGLLFIGNFIVNIFTFALFFLIYFPIWYLAYNLYINKVFDKYINQRFYPEIVNRGIWRI
ncbi:MAG: hypothetical protein IJ656_03465 [Bacilli bacterium]|nr:hypothetical protein [Bacilli bacterium]MBR1582072.1 hypothetical protein [Bacilli bacterium]